MNKRRLALTFAFIMTILPSQQQAASLNRQDRILHHHRPSTADTCLSRLSSSDEDEVCRRLLRRRLPVQGRQTKESAERPSEADVTTSHSPICRLLCYSGLVNRWQSSLCTKHCRRQTDSDRPVAFSKKWGNRVGRWSKRWSSRVCLEAHCKPFENNVRAFMACGQSQCHGK